MSPDARNPAVAGRFYPARPDELLETVKEYLSASNVVAGDHIESEAREPPAKSDRIEAIGCVAPHAGYIYSGAVAGALFASIEIPRRCVILCPNHTGMGAPLAIMADTVWRTPVGDVEPDAEFAAELLLRFPPLQEDSAAHRHEHAIEVQLPFFQVRQPEVQIVPIVIGVRNFDLLRAFGEALANVIASEAQRADREKILIVASSDMNHYESDAVTRIKDRKAIDRMLALDQTGLMEAVVKEEISMCGFGPAVVMLTAAKILGATKASLIRYSTSGEVSGDLDSVVGYAGIAVS